MAKIKPINDTTFEVEMPSGDKVEIGDREATKFKPHLKLNRWGDECFLAIQPAGYIEQEIEEELEGDKIKCKYKVKQEDIEFELESEFYPLEPRTVVAAKDRRGRDVPFTQNELGGFEFEVVLKEKPVSNQIVFDIQAQGLRFSYQPPLTQGEIDKGTIRPDNVIGSYAVYHAIRGNSHGNNVDAEKYKTGKAFHIYRPHLVDAVGSEAWADLNIFNGVLAIILPQQFLDEAVYPVTVDPDFGYTAIGGSSIAIGTYDTSMRAGSAWAMPAPGGTANYIKAYLESEWNPGCKAFINQKDSVAAGQHGQIATKENLGITPGPHWEQFNLANEPLTAAVVYILNVTCDYAAIGETHLYYDANGAVASYIEYQIYAAPESPWVVNPEGTTLDYSIYCNYTEAVAGWTGKISGVTNPAKVMGVAVANIAKVKGVA